MDSNGSASKAMTLPDAMQDHWANVAPTCYYCYDTIYTWGAFVGLLHSTSSIYFILNTTNTYWYVRSAIAPAPTKAPHVYILYFHCATQLFSSCNGHITKQTWCAFQLKYKLCHGRADNNIDSTMQLYCNRNVTFFSSNTSPGRSFLFS